MDSLMDAALKEKAYAQCRWQVGGEDEVPYIVLEARCKCGWVGKPPKVFEKGCGFRQCPDCDSRDLERTG